MRPLIVAVVSAMAFGLPAAALARQDSAAPPPQAAAPADVETPPLGQVGVAGAIGVPLGDFRDNVEIAGGISGSFGIGLGHTPIIVGAEATYLMYGGEDRNLPVGGLPDLTVGVNTANEMILLHGRVRAQKPTGRVRPYVDGLVGFNYLRTTTRVDAGDYCWSYGGSSSCREDGDSVTNLDDLVLSAGGGAGLGIALTRSGKVRLDLSLRYLYGGEARYLTEGDIRWTEEGPPGLRPRRTRTDLLLIGIGIVLGR